MSLSDIPIHALKEEMLTLLGEMAVHTDEPENPGVTRPLYGVSWLSAQAALAARMEEAGLSVRYDNVGNLYGRLAGERDSEAAVLTGSHVDSVRHGGRFDGTYGIAAGIAALGYLRRTHGKPLRPLEVVSFCEEEGSRFPIAYWGSGNATGIYDWRQAGSYKDEDGVSLEEAMQASGFGRADGPDCRLAPLAGFVELHIEQGLVLEHRNRRIGIVESIVGQRRYALSIEGAANHAGTTPMTLRQDALAGAAEIALKLESLASSWGEPLVATVGKIEARPNTPNVIPGYVEMTLDIRHSDEWSLSAFSDLVLSEIQRITDRRRLRLAVTPWLATKPVPMNERLTARVEAACAGLSLSYQRMVSGAGHDAQLMAPLCPTTMIFVPSRAGISHSPDEYTSPEQLAEGAAVLVSVLYDLAYKE
ncbi:Zn-dependent hydrolase [Cohnella hashimotonis]|uniref:Zn-dependent hydrolase n=1 Tax=Cohnella hashimotonis TaxID=2826895 RepID=A0ABT6TIZ7_9BACL|nr:Zn-dependent hydrolase [Cohnella hashimotonis]MDI4646253.1 Zn-dependent hydrolase [Cohnella hashimotonis]